MLVGIGVTIFIFANCVVNLNEYGVDNSEPTVNDSDLIESDSQTVGDIVMSEKETTSAESVAKEEYTTKAEGEEETTKPSETTKREEATNSEVTTESEEKKTNSEEKTTNSEEETTNSEQETTKIDDINKTYTYLECNQKMWVTTHINVRKGPDVIFEVIGGLSESQEVNVTGQCKETSWYRVEYDGGIGYVSNKYLNLSNPNTGNKTEEQTKSEEETTKPVPEKPTKKPEEEKPVPEKPTPKPGDEKPAPEKPTPKPGDEKPAPEKPTPKPKS
jgi:uncharacterized protein YraI